MTSSAGIHQKGSTSLMKIIANAKQRADFVKAGAIATITGVVRGENSKGDTVEKLQLEAYEEKANEVLALICNDLMNEPGIIDVQIHHMLGEFEVGEDIVYVLVAGSHRKKVFQTLATAVDRYKKEAPIFKKEYVRSGKDAAKGHWITETDDLSEV